MIPGYHGKYLRLDLSNKIMDFPEIGSDIYSQVIGGVGLGVWILTRETPVGYDPLSPDAALVFALSPLVGTPLTTSAKFAVIAKSPLTNRICDAMCSSHFAMAAKKVGVDAISIKGKLEEPSILFIDGTADTPIDFRIIPAAPYLGHSASETEKQIRLESGNDWQIISIGLGGEMQIPFATLSHDGRHAGRGGLGAVLGSKNIKAIAVRGDKRTNIANPNETMKIARSLSERSFTPATAKYRELGTVANLLVFNRFESLPTRNFQEGSFLEVESLTQHDLAPARKIAKNSCAACTIGCEHIYSLKSDKGENTRGVRMEYESLFALGPLCGVSDPEMVLKASALCDEFGLDTISTGGTIAFLMECLDKKFIPQVLVDNVSPKFGDGGSILRLIDDMMSPDPSQIAQLLKLGSRNAAHEIGQKSIAFAQQVKGLEMPGYHPRKLHAMALGMAVGCRGADHNRTGAYEVDFSEHHRSAHSVALAVIETEDKAAIMDSLILCKFIRGVFQDFFQESAEMLSAVTGTCYTKDSLIESAKLIVRMRKAFNQREGWTPEEDALPESIFAQDSTEESYLTKTRLEDLIKHYYAGRGFSDEGWLSDLQMQCISRLESDHSTE